MQVSLMLYSLKIIKLHDWIINFVSPLEAVPECPFRSAVLRALHEWFIFYILLCFLLLLFSQLFVRFPQTANFLFLYFFFLANTLFQQHKRKLYTWTSTDDQHRNQIDYILCSQRWTSIQSAKTRLGAACGSDHELLIAKFRLKLKKVGKTTRPFKYDLNQSPYDYTVKVRNRFKGLDLIDRVPDELWNEVRDIVQETGIKTIPKKKKRIKSKMAV